MTQQTRQLVDKIKADKKHLAEMQKRSITTWSDAEWIAVNENLTEALKQLNIQ